MPKRWRDVVPNRDEQKALKRQAVLSVGARLFHERGYSQTFLDDIAAELGVSKPSLYYYVKNKEEILYEVVQASLAMATAAFEQADAEGGSGRERVLLFFREYLKHVFSEFGRCAVTVDINALDAEMHERIVTVRHEIDHKVRAYVRAGMSDGSIASRDPALITFFLFGAFNWVGQWWREDGALTRQQISDSFLDYAGELLSGVGRP
jgi:AcrR family transcriptional regulator